MMSWAEILGLEIRAARRRLVQSFISSPAENLSGKCVLIDVEIGLHDCFAIIKAKRLTISH